VICQEVLGEDQVAMGTDKLVLETEWQVRVVPDMDHERQEVQVGGTKGAWG